MSLPNSHHRVRFVNHVRVRIKKLSNNRINSSLINSFHFDHALISTHVRVTAKSEGLHLRNKLLDISVCMKLLYCKIFERQSCNFLEIFYCQRSAVIRRHYNEHN